MTKSERLASEVCEALPENYPGTETEALIELQRLITETVEANDIDSAIFHRYGDWLVYESRDGNFHLEYCVAYSEIDGSFIFTREIYWQTETHARHYALIQQDSVDMEPFEFFAEVFRDMICH